LYRFRVIWRWKNGDLEIWVRGHPRSLKMVPFESLGAVSYSPSIVTVAVSVAVSEIFSVEEWRDFETRVRGRPRSLEMVPFDRLYTSSYCCVFFKYYNFTRGQWVQKGLELSHSHYSKSFFHFKFYFGVIVTAPAENNRDYLKWTKIPEVRIK